MKLFQIQKRIFDIVIGFALLIVSLLIIIPVSILIVVEDGFPIIFKQIRVGKNRELFYIYKLRSMKKKGNSSSNVKISSGWSDSVPDNFVFKSTGDVNPNITQVGKFIRKMSIDELPQFINVVLGNMSLVGPRPEIQEIANFYDENQLKRLNVKPGITGWAQINGRSDMTHKEKIDFDLFYVENQSFKLDLLIFFKTLSVVFTGRGSK
ncbi:sugar transferase [Carnobacterium divergens]|uniref:sugar transferase n=1 Tax=Carnobacterium divergens TaxID=2748 RepID=UPI0039B00429